MARLRGVNLAGWLVLEKWMTPSLFESTDAIDEYTFMHTPNAAKKLEEHRKTFITEKDFEWLHNNGLNAVRLPVGYWILTGDAPYEGGIAYVDWAFRMAEKYNLYVLLDLHGAPKSQNGHDHSGRAGQAEWFNDPAARQQTIDILKQLYARYKTSPSLWGIELLNEPYAGWRNPTLRQFYKQAASSLVGSTKIIFHDGFRPRTVNGTLASDPRAVIDVHLYHMASWIARYLPIHTFVRIFDWWWGRLLRRLGKQQPVVVGEWSCVLKGEALDHLAPHVARQLQYSFGAKQLAVFEQASTGWFYWNYKTEDRESLWNFRQLVENGHLRVPK
ncbi:MAG TPA: cellulase family glycosylhydrolase [Candidatus Saccharibacteria bacterium]|nr:cellulase family glycosylhydrolase [Candidatus Saccharibacteria bacterium]